MKHDLEVEDATLPVGMFWIASPEEQWLRVGCVTQDNGDHILVDIYRNPGDARSGSAMECGRRYEIGVQD